MENVYEREPNGKGEIMKLSTNKRKIEVKKKCRETPRMDDQKMKTKSAETKRIDQWRKEMELKKGCPREWKTEKIGNSKKGWQSEKEKKGLKPRNRQKEMWRKNNKEKQRWEKKT